MTKQGGEPSADCHDGKDDEPNEGEKDIHLVKVQRFNKGLQTLIHQRRTGELHREGIADQEGAGGCEE